MKCQGRPAMPAMHGYRAAKAQGCDREATCEISYRGVWRLACAVHAARSFPDLPRRRLERAR